MPPLKPPGKIENFFLNGVRGGISNTNFLYFTFFREPLHYGLSPIEKGDIKNFKFKTLLHIQLWSKNVQTFFKWCQTPKSWLLILVFIIYVKYLQSYLQKTWRGGLTNLKFCVLANQLEPKKRVENNIFVRGPLHGANIGQIFSSPFSSENMFWNICSHF